MSMSSITAATLSSTSEPIIITVTGCPTGSWPGKRVRASVWLMTALLTDPFHASLLPSISRNENMSKNVESAMPTVPSTILSPECISMEDWPANAVVFSISG